MIPRSPLRISAFNLSTAHRRFGEVPAYHGPRLAAPELVRLAAPNPLS